MNITHFNPLKTRTPLLIPAFQSLENVNAGTNEHEAATDLICQTLYICEGDGFQVLWEKEFVFC